MGSGSTWTTDFSTIAGVRSKSCPATRVVVIVLFSLICTYRSVTENDGRTESIIRWWSIHARPGAPSGCEHPDPSLLDGVTQPPGSLTPPACVSGAEIL